MKRGLARLGVAVWLLQEVKVPVEASKTLEDAVEEKALLQSSIRVWGPDACVPSQLLRAAESL